MISISAYTLNSSALSSQASKQSALINHPVQSTSELSGHQSEAFSRQDSSPRWRQLISMAEQHYNTGQRAKSLYSQNQGPSDPSKRSGSHSVDTFA